MAPGSALFCVVPGFETKYSRSLGVCTVAGTKQIHVRSLERDAGQDHSASIKKQTEGTESGFDTFDNSPQIPSEAGSSSTQL